MEQRVKVSNLVDINDRDWPNLVFVGTVLKGPMPVLHICRRDGYRSHPMDKRRGWQYHITNCTRAMQHVFYFRNSIYAGWDKFRLCARCGTQADFEQAFEEMTSGWEGRQVELEEEKRAEEAARQQAWEERFARMCRLQVILADAQQHLNPSGFGVRIGGVGVESGNLYLWYEGIRFQVEENPES